MLAHFSGVTTPTVVNFSQAIYMMSLNVGLG